ncbi:hypothetical protein HZ326_21266 [Fusarium oxysporum f. sp. albedinis]|nr:hypothetical protein HZ326_21266 [Fusarium oxysporum f. sp. albedinis]
MRRGTLPAVWTSPLNAHDHQTLPKAQDNNQDERRATKSIRFNLARIEIMPFSHLSIHPITRPMVSRTLACQNTPNM